MQLSIYMLMGTTLQVSTTRLSALIVNMTRKMAAVRKPVVGNLQIFYASYSPQSLKLLVEIG
jgi:hypothetical protein